MKIVVESGKNLIKTSLPENIAGNYWIIDSNYKNLLNVSGENGKWIIKSNADIKISNNILNDDLNNADFIESDVLDINRIYYAANTVTKEKYILYTLPSYENFENLIFDYSKISNITIGVDNSCDIVVKNLLFAQKQLTIEYDKQTGGIIVKNLSDKYNLFINNTICNQSYLTRGDLLFISGIYIYFFGTLLLVGNNREDLVFNSSKLSKRVMYENPNIDYSNVVDREISFFDKTKYFQRPPRFKRQIENKIFNIDPPTQKERQEEMPLIFTIAPMLTMGMMSMVSGVTALQKVLSGESTVKEQFSSLLMCGCMLISMILFPLVQKFYTKHKKIKDCF